MEQQRKRHIPDWLAIPGALLGFVAVLGFSVFFWIVDLLSCSGDGGSPYAARASPYGKLCENGTVETSAYLVLIIPALAIIVGAAVALYLRRYIPLVISFAVAVAVFALNLGLLAAVPDSCTEDQREAEEDCEQY